MAMSAMLSHSIPTYYSCRCRITVPFKPKAGLVRHEAFLEGFSLMTLRSREKHVRSFRRSLIVSAAGKEHELTDSDIPDEQVELVNALGVEEASTAQKVESNESKDSNLGSSDSIHKSSELQKGKEGKINFPLEATSPGIENASQVSAQASKKAAKIHDFCLGIPYGGILVGGGILGLFMNGDAIGLLLGLALLGLSILSLRFWKQGKSSTPYILGQAVLTFIQLWRQLQTFFMTKNIFPTGILVALSAAMLSFYSYVAASGGNPPPKKLRPALNEA